VVIFDSGVGGLSILQAARAQLPHCRFSYVSDNAGFPYGDKAAHVVIERACSVLERFAQQVHDADVYVVACNTASTLALPRLRRHFTQPVVGVVPAVKPAAAHSKNHYLGLLATPGTIERPYTKQLIAEYAADSHVVSVGSTELVQLAEQKLRQRPVSATALKRILQPFLQPGSSNPHPEHLDTLVLACTHFPLLAQEIQGVVGPHIKLIDSGSAIAARIAYWLAQRGSHDDAGGQPTYAWFSRADSGIAGLSGALKALGLAETRLLP
jgi:glutamate racemase